MSLRGLREDSLLRQMIHEGARIAALMLFWVTISGVGVWLKYVSTTGSLFVDVGRALTQIAIVTGLASVLLYVMARGIALGRSSGFERRRA